MMKYERLRYLDIHTIQVSSSCFSLCVYDNVLISNECFILKCITATFLHTHAFQVCWGISLLCCSYLCDEAINEKSMHVRFIATVKLFYHRFSAIFCFASLFISISLVSSIGFT